MRPTSLLQLAATTSGLVMLLASASPVVTIAEEEDGSWMAYFGQMWLGLVIGVLLIMWTHMGMKKQQVIEDLPAAQVFIPRPFTADELIKYRGRGKPQNGANPNEFRETLQMMGEKAAKKKEAASPSSPSPSTKGTADDDVAEDESDLIFIGVKGIIYNVSPQWYGPGSPYNVFAGREASRHLGKIVVGTDESNADWTTLSPEHIASLGEWEDRFKSKYTPVGWFVPDADYYERARKFDP